MTLFEKLGPQAVARINLLRRKRRIIAIHHAQNGTHLILVDASTLLLEGTNVEDSRRLVGYLGFHGGGADGLDTPAFAVKPNT